MKKKCRSFQCGSNTLTMRMTKPPVRPTRSAAGPVFFTEVPMTARAPGTRESVTRSKQERDKLVEVVHNPDMRGRDICQREIINGELLNFKFWGNLRESRTDVKNTLPDFRTIEKERLAIEFDHNKRTNPQNVGYKEFYDNFYDKDYTSRSKNLELCD